MKSRFAMIASGLFAMTIAACATDAPSTADDPAASDDADPTEALADDPTPPTGWTAADVAGEPDAAPGDILLGDDSTAPVIACPPGHVCFYSDPGFRGSCSFAILVSAAVPDFRTLRCLGGGSFDNKLSSWKNPTGRRYCWYADPFFRGRRHVMNPHTAAARLPPGSDNTASSAGPC